MRHFFRPRPHRVPLAGIPYPVRLLATAAVYLALARLGVAMAYHGQDASLVWPAHGFALAALLLCGLRTWPAILVAVYASAMMSGASLLSAALVAAGNTLGPVVGVLLLRSVDFRVSLDRARDAAALILLGGMVSSLISATVGVATLWARGIYAPGTAPTHWMVWWAGDMAGLVTTAPLLLVWARRPCWWSRPRVRLEFAVSMSLVGAVSLFAFEWVAPFRSEYPLAYLVFPAAIWVAIWFERHGAVALTAVVSAAAIWQTLHNEGPFARPSMQETLMHLQAFVSVVAVSALLLAIMIAERRRLERAQRRLLRRERRSREEAQRAVAAREKALAVASHEIRNPLATVLLNSSALLEGDPARRGDPELRSALRSIVVSAEQIDHVVRDLSDITRLEAGQISLERSPCSPVSLLAQADDMLGPLAAEQGLDLRLRVPHDLPRVLAHPERVQQVIGNLVGNAIRLTAPGGRIVLQAWQELDQVWIAVEDSGPGMTEEQIEELLLPFWDSPLRSSTGRGLGIPIARAIVTAHGGAFRVDSEPGRGTRISFSLPLAEAGEPAESKVEREERSPLVRSTG